LVHPLETWKKFSKDEMHQIRVYAERFQVDEKVYEDAIELGAIMLEEYLKEYGEDDSWSFIATERPFQIYIPGPDGSKVAIYLGTFDGVYRDLNTGEIWLLETKTTGAISTSHLNLDDQAGSYWAVASSILRKEGLLGPKESIAGVMYNFLRKTTPDPRPRHPATGEYTNKPTKEHYIAALQGRDIRFVEQSSPKSGPIAIEKAKVADLETACEFASITVYGEVSRVQPLPMFARVPVNRTKRERNTQIRRIAAEVQAMEAYRSGELPLIKTPRSTGHDACQHGCEFFEMCTLHEAGADWEMYRDAMFRKHDPYADHRKSAHMAS
jgi:hypothetical protein